MSIKEDDKKYIVNSYNRFDLTLTSSDSGTLIDEAGKRYIDMGSGIAVNSFGNGDLVWQEAVIAQVRTMSHVSNLYYSEPQVKLASALISRTGMSRVFFSNSGAEANECAIKVARKYSSDKYGDDRNVIITLKNSFHGRTLATLAATGQDGFHTSFGPFPEGFVYAEANNFADVEKLATENNCCAIMMELVQGEGGVVALNRDFVTSCEAYCKSHDLMLIIDEVQTGNGRSGSLYAYMEYGISPDIVSTAKGLAGGLPLGATMVGEKCKDVLTAGTHGSTFGGNPICCAGALSVIDRIDDALLAEVKKKSEYIFTELTGAPGVAGVSGLGLMIGIEPTGEAGPIVRSLIDKGVIVLTAKKKIRLLPPLNISQKDLQTAVSLIKQELAAQA